jgi:hypothetical protein
MNLYKQNNINNWLALSILLSFHPYVPAWMIPEILEVEIITGWWFGVGVWL